MDRQRIRLPDGTMGKVRDFDQFPVIMKVILLLETTGNYFLPWLREYVKVRPLDLDCETERRQIALGVDSYPFLPIDRPVDWHLRGHLVETHEFVGDLFSFVLVPLTDKRVEVIIRCHDPDGMDWFKELLVEIRERWPEARQKPEGAPEDMDMPRGPTLKTQEESVLLKKLKDQNPTWSQVRLAAKASLELGTEISPDRVRYIYRVMNWEWERADRIR